MKKPHGYLPVDVQPIELSYAMNVHRRSDYSVHPVLLDFEKLGAHFPLKVLPNEKQLYLLFGGTYGNFPSEKINSYLKTIYDSKTSILIIGMPLLISKKNILDAYANLQYENMTFGPLKHMGFKKTDFVKNREYPGFVVRLKYSRTPNVRSNAHGTL